MPTTLHESRPSAGIGVVEVQKPMVFGDFYPARVTLCGDRRGRAARATLCGDRRGRGAKTHGFLRFLTCSRDPLRGSAWSRCKNPWFFAISNLLARPSAGIGVVEVQKPMVFFAISAVLAQPSNLLARPSAGIRLAEVQNHMVFAISAVLAQPSAGIGVVEVQKLTSGVVSWFARLLRNRRVAGSIPPWSAGGRRKMQLAFYSNLRRATCAEQVAQSNSDQLAPTSLRRAPCLEQLAQSNFRRATCTEQLAGSAICTEQLAGTNLPEQLARSNLRSATCTVQLA